MHKISRVFNKKTSILLLLISLLSVSGILAGNGYVSAAVNIVTASGGDNVSLDNSASAQGGGSFITLNPITINESTIGEIKAGSHNFILPSQWELDQNSPIAITLNWEQSGMGITNDYTFYPQSPYFFFVTIDIESNQAPASLTFSNIKIRPTGSAPTNAFKIIHSGSDIVGVTNGTGDGVTGTSFGLLKTVAGSAKKIVISNPADATVGNAVSVTLEVQDQFGNKVASANDQAVTVTVDGDAKISSVTTGAGDGTYNSNSEVITSNGGQIVLTITDATAQTVNIITNHATLDHSSTQNVVFAAAASNNNNTNNGGGSPVVSGGITITSGGGGSNEAVGLIYPQPTGDNIITVNKKIISSSSDGTKIENDFMTIRDNVELIQVRVQSGISPAATIKDGQIITLYTADISEAKNISLYLPSDCLGNIGLSSSGYPNKVIASIVAQKAAAEQISEEARDGMYLFGFKRFTVGLNVKNNNLLTLEKPTQISFDMSGIKYPEESSIAWFDPTVKKWVNLGGVFKDNILSANITKLGDFGIIRTLEQRRRIESLSAGQAEILGIKVDNGQPSGQEEVSQKLTEAEILAKGDAKTLAASVFAKRVIAKENAAYNQYVKNLVKGVKNLTNLNIYAYTNFIAYGSESAFKLGAGERVGVLNSYKAAFGKLPVTVRDWQDIINIATGHWTSERNTIAENKAKITFRAVYRREADLTNKYDEAAINILAYGILPSERNLASEQAAIRTFKAVFKKNPLTATEWNTVRAIAYSGAKR
ncbi:hypothetical protein COU00_00570 [Candidatus Falkowbacteria bacterium CG10_big_fil_rev_8_21_14_0_10_43_11]|uniref:Big-1 domain-containing protein n=1 Tax=Candidatus Falkowbacteria bacterium CG10_big_fil_rev_8_21_14_0_10_43_11 TaxID=1974568 RepID=A0A2M6WN29_9BACT|nr:MAG: hypothetical protein COU00_00570 [Candidatus Falkowbacteria bacterium CG10_big_fil_rev_8_21_14_0_10_43_11]